MFQRNLPAWWYRKGIIHGELVIAEMCCQQLGLAHVECCACAAVYIVCAPQIYLQVSKDATMVALSRPGEYLLMAAFTPVISKDTAMTACNRALRWIKREEANLFVM